MGRILALDLGSKNIGVAISDERKIISQTLTTLKRTSRAQVLARLKELVKEHSVQELVVGLPINMDGSIGTQGEKAIGEAERLKIGLGLPVHLWDERLSTVEAEKTLIQANLSRRKRRKITHKLAAQIILQGYLDGCRQEGEGRHTP